jgi:hypothetical protein
MVTVKHWLGLALSVSLALGVVGGCGGDDGGSGGAGGASGKAGGGGKGGKGGSGGKSGSGSKMMPLPSKQECIDMAKAMGTNPPELDCSCEKCTRKISDCTNDPGCTEIEQCAIKTGCRGNDCYFSTPECMMIIDKWGSTGLSTTLATQLQDCNDTMKCSMAPMTECPQEKISYMGMSLTLPGCCKDQKCGLNASTMGCIERTLISAATMGNFQAISCGLGGSGGAGGAAGGAGGAGGKSGDGADAGI